MRDAGPIVLKLGQSQFIKKDSMGRGSFWYFYVNCLVARVTYVAFCTRHSPSNEAFGREPRISMGKQFHVISAGQVLLLMFAKHSLVLFTGNKTLLAQPQVIDARSTLGCNTSVAQWGSKEMLVKLTRKKKKKPPKNKTKKTPTTIKNIRVQTILTHLGVD